MGDPIFIHGIDLAAGITLVLKVLIAFVILLVSVLMMIWFERKVISDMQNRIGPDRAARSRRCSARRRPAPSCPWRPSTRTPCAWCRPAPCTTGRS